MMVKTVRWSSSSTAIRNIPVTVLDCHGNWMPTKFSRYDVADYLKSEEDMAVYLEACFEEAGDDATFSLPPSATSPAPSAWSALRKKPG